MYTMTQNEAVFMAVSAVFGSELENDGRVPPTTEWPESKKNEVTALMMASYKAGEWDKNSGGKDEASVLKYIPGLVNNHVRKDLRLNGGTKYEAKRPGSRQGTGDESVKAMRQLLALTTDPAAKKQIEDEISKRLLAIKPKVEIAVDKLPESLRHIAAALKS